MVLSNDDFYALQLLIRTIDHYNDNELKSGRLTRYIKEIKKILKRGREDD